MCDGVYGSSVSGLETYLTRAKWDEIDRRELATLRRMPLEGQYSLLERATDESRGLEQGR